VDTEAFELARAMVPLLERGAEVLRLRLASLPVRMRPTGDIDVVTESDFVAHARTVLRHVKHNAATTHILCEDGTRFVVVELLNTRW
jgi:hypothetical protein